MLCNACPTVSTGSASLLLLKGEHCWCGTGNKIGNASSVTGNVSGGSDGSDGSDGSYGSYGSNGGTSNAGTSNAKRKAGEVCHPALSTWAPSWGFVTKMCMRKKLGM